jgi:hypothetical protein
VARMVRKTVPGLPMYRKNFVENRTATGMTSCSVHSSEAKQLYTLVRCYGPHVVNG